MLADAENAGQGTKRSRGGVHRDCVSVREMRERERRWMQDLKTMRQEVDGAEGAMRLAAREAAAAKAKVATLEAEVASLRANGGQ